MSRRVEITESCRQHSNDRMHKRKEELIQAANGFLNWRDRTWENLKQKRVQAVVSTDDWLNSKLLIAKVFSKAVEITPALGSGLDDTLYKLNTCEESCENRFIVLINIGFLIDKLVKHAQQTKFLMCFSPEIFWTESSAVETHFRQFNNQH